MQISVQFHVIEEVELKAIGEDLRRNTEFIGARNDFIVNVRQAHHMI